ncbi:MAG: hypothetical protein AVDCRST_MAG10-151, partial [uncultured Acidimicrobiales bacterium]
GTDRRYDTGNASRQRRAHAGAGRALLVGAGPGRRSGAEATLAL